MTSGETLSGKVRTKSKRGRLNFWVDVVVLISGTLTLSSGCVMWTKFHIGRGVLNDVAFGVSRLTWLNVHRFTALVALASLAIHVYLHRHVIVAKVRRAWLRLPGRASRLDLLLYVCFVLTALGAVVAWFIVPGSAPLSGPVELGPLPAARHFFLDLHNFAGLGFLLAAALHVRRRGAGLLQYRSAI
jgi:hypothetical protein